MRRNLILISMLLLLGSGAKAADAREAVLAALHRWGTAAGVAVARIEVPVAPSCAETADGLRVKRVHFDAMLRSWVVEVSCAGFTVPVLAIVHVNDPQWLSVDDKSRVTTPLLVRAGETRRLTVELSGVRIAETVICLKAGRAGDIIRVRSRDRKMTRRALVSETGELVLAGGR
ncbi:MAG: hypothetical protein ROO76_01735 [Terriglobia bacterium]|jgi:hypothetical protein|nr:hypothetical protein [Terriglobia bacterium]